MTKLLEKAIAEISTLPAETQEKLGQEMLIYVEQVRELKAKVGEGITSLKRGEGQPLDIEAIIARARSEYGRP